MYLKPKTNTNGTPGNGCLFCPFYGDGQGFVPDKLEDQSEVLVVGQNPGADEEAGRRLIGYDGPKRPKYEACNPQPFIGETGHAMDTRYIPQSGVSRDSISLGNSIRCRLNHHNDLPGLHQVNIRKAIEHCHKAHFKLPPKTKLIVAQGNYALYAMTGQGQLENHKIDSWRGFMLPFQPIGGGYESSNMIYTPQLSDKTIPVLATYHIAYTLYDPTAIVVTKWDWGKISKYLAGKWPQYLPPINYGPPQVWPQVTAFDTEYIPSIKEFICYSMYDGKELRVSDILLRGDWLSDGKPHIIFHNAVADIPYLRELFPEYSFDDTMHQHAVLWSDFPHDLGFLGSLYCSINRWKHLDYLNPKLYSAADAFATWEIHNALKLELDRDPRSKLIYETKNLKLPLIILRAHETGIKVNPAKAKIRYEERLAKVRDLGVRAQAIAGWPINTRSNPQVSHHIFDVESLNKIT